jgi:hypothetical protein
LTPELKLVALHASATQSALVILAKCLMNNGALLPGQFPNALKTTFNAAEAEWDRPDYQFLQGLAKMLEDAEILDRK